jgi:thiol-disulfide isomerase/thioredoxin
MNLLIAALIFTLCLTILNFTLLLRILTWFRAKQDLREKEVRAEMAQELVIGSLTPNFNAKTFAGNYVSQNDFLGQPALFVFFSVDCFRCRKEMPTLVRLSKQAKAKANVNFILISEVGTTETLKWKDWLLEEDKVDIDIPFILSPSGLFDFFETYNPKSITPYFCFVDEKGILKARDPIGSENWEALKREWEGVVPLPARARLRLH